MSVISPFLSLFTYPILSRSSHIASYAWSGLGNVLYSLFGAHGGFSRHQQSEFCRIARRIAPLCVRVGKITFAFAFHIYWGLTAFPVRCRRFGPSTHLPRFYFESKFNWFGSSLGVFVRFKLGGSAPRDLCAYDVTFRFKLYAHISIARYFQVRKLRRRVRFPILIRQF